MTLAGAANVLGKVPEGDYAAGDADAARIAWQALGDVLGCSAEEAAGRAMAIAVGKVREIVAALVKAYELSPATLCLAGGGGSGGIIVPYLGEWMGCKWKIIKNAPIISTIGVALAMVREVVERTVAQPKEEDIRSIRREAVAQVMRSGACEASVEVSIEIDKQANILRAIAVGATELRTRDLMHPAMGERDLLRQAAAAMAVPEVHVQEIAATGKWHAFEGVQKKAGFLFFKKKKHVLCILDRDGVVCLQREEPAALFVAKHELSEELTALIDANTEYGTVGGQLPKLYVYFGEKQLDLSGLISREQIDAVLHMELDGIAAEQMIFVVAIK